jgi:transposase
VNNARSYGVLSNTAWAALAPLIEALRPHGKTQPEKLRRNIEAIIWRHQNGAKWRAIPLEPAPWSRACQCFNGWTHHGVRERLPGLTQSEAGGPALGLRFLDGSTIRAHRCAAGVRKAGRSGAERDAEAALGRSRGGYGTKAMALVDSHGHAVAFHLAAGQVHEAPLAEALLDAVALDAPLWVVGDEGHSSAAIRARIRGMGAKPAIPSTSNEAPARCPHWIHRHRNEVERPWARLKEWRAVATRYEKPAGSFLGVLCLLATTEVTHGLIRKDGENRGNGCNSQDRPEPKPRIHRHVAILICHDVINALHALFL